MRVSGSSGGWGEQWWARPTGILGIGDFVLSGGGWPGERGGFEGAALTSVVRRSGLSKGLIVRRGVDPVGVIKKCGSFWVCSELIFIFASPSKEG